jgi:hypothetical protein
LLIIPDRNAKDAVMNARTNAMPPASFTGFAEKALLSLENLEYKRILGGEDLEDVYRLRYEAYRRKELIEQNDSGLAEDKYDTTPNCQIFGLYFEGKLASSMRIHHATPDNRVCPTTSHFPQALDEHFDKGMSFIDSSRFCADAEMSVKQPMLALFTTRLTAMACRYFEADYMLSVIRPEHSGFYRRYFAMKRWGTGQKVDWFAFEVDLYSAEHDEIEDRVMARVPFFRSMEHEREALFGQVADGILSVTVKPTASQALSQNH